MAFAQLTLRTGLRGIENTLRANGSLLYHMGFRCETISRTTLSNKVRPASRPIRADFKASRPSRGRRRKPWRA
jgi:hypothetical protein